MLPIYTTGTCLASNSRKHLLRNHGLSRKWVFLAGVLLSCTQVVLAQQGPGGLGGYTGVEAINNTSITVQVKGPDGSKLNSMAIVNVSNLFGQMVRSQTTFGSNTVFQIGAGEYIIEIEASGFEKARVQADVSSANPNRVVTVKLKPEDSSVNYVAGTVTPLPPKAQKELAKSVESFQTNKIDEAVRHLESANQIAPNHPDILYMLGTAYQKKSDFMDARKYWDEALQGEPRHMASLLACADMLIRSDDIAGARSYLDRAVAASPNSWRAQNLLATVLLRQNSYAEAVAHAERALELGKAQANSALLTLGQSLAAEGHNDQAIAALKDYLAAKPPAENIQPVQNLIERIKTAAYSPSGPNVGGVTAIVEKGTSSGDLPDLPLSAAAMHWLPANVDDTTPPVEPGVSCSLPDVLKNASSHVSELPTIVDRYTATEVLHHEDVNNAGYADHVENLSFNYLASIREIKSKYGQFLDVQEYRNGSTGNDMFPNQMASTGLPSIVLIFHPWMISDFDFKCEGLSRINSGFAWQLYFSQKGSIPSRIRQYRISGHVYPIALKGRAWVDASTFQVVRLETDLREPHPDLRLNAEHLIMEYGPVQFKKRKEVLWLPSSAEYFAVLRGRRFHRQHTFANYVLFSIDDQQKIGAPPKDKTTASAATDSKLSN